MKAVAVIIQRDDKILLSKRAIDKEIEPSKWENISGSVEEDEDFEQAILREVKEEIGVNVFNLKIALEYKDKMSNPEVVVFYGEIVEEPKIMEPNNCSELKWFKINELDKADLAKYTLKDFVRLNWIKIK